MNEAPRSDLQSIPAKANETLSCYASSPPMDLRSFVPMSTYSGPSFLVIQSFALEERIVIAKIVLSSSLSFLLIIIRAPVLSANPIKMSSSFSIFPHYDFF
jgi:hypothetical protein